LVAEIRILSPPRCLRVSLMAKPISDGFAQ
jgi:hypothetical protein